MCYLSVSSPPTPHPKVSCGEGWRLAGVVGNLWYGSRVGFPESSYVREGKRKTVSSRGCLDSAVFGKVVGVGSLSLWSEGQIPQNSPGEESWRYPSW